MVTLRFEKDSIPTREELAQIIQELKARNTPIDDLLDLAQTLMHFEQQYNMTSAEFYEKFNRGEMGDSMDFVKWAGRYRLYLDLKKKLELSLERVIAA
ncbi:MAG: hypothetical protein ACE5MB_09620 [Anaerolineae bacterium]